MEVLSKLRLHKVAEECLVKDQQLKEVVAFCNSQSQALEVVDCLQEELHPQHSVADKQEEAHCLAVAKQ